MASLALRGGTPLFPKELTVPWPQYDSSDEQSLLSCYRSGIWWRGGTIQDQEKSACGRFERAFAAFHDSPYGLAVSNGTIALELALRAAGVGPGDEVLVPALSFVVTASAALTLGAYPVFVDVDPDTFQIDPAHLESLIGPRTRAICLVHLAGYPADLDRIVPLAKKHKLALVEDCAHSQGTQWRGKGVGSYGDFGTFSFQQFKSLCCGEGGIVLAGTQESWSKLYRYHNLGRKENEGFHDFYEPSSNYRLTDLQGSLLESQFKKFEPQLRRRMESARVLSAGLAEVGGISALPADSRITRRGYYYFLMRYRKEAFKGVHRDKFIEALSAEGIPGVGKAYGKPIHKYPLFQNLRVPSEHANCRYASLSLPIVERIMGEELISLHHPFLLATKEALALFIAAVEKIKDHAEELL